MSHIDRLLEIMERLRNPEDGCPWDRDQTFGSIVPHTLEEAYEVADAIDQEDWQALPEEVGDLLFQVVFYAQLGKEAGCFDFGDIVAAANAKLVRRHPHVFGDEEVRDAADQSRRWEAHKAAERARSQGGDGSVLDGVAGAFPAVQRAGKLQGRAERAGFEWPRDEDSFAKVDEELGELRHEVAEGASLQRLEHEAGDLLFAAVGLARRLGVDPETALRTSNRRFERRFRHMENQLTQQGLGMEEMELDDLKVHWQAAKRATDGADE
ncbi:nucleoside triphosphate pyrophosphohydrolase [Thiohalorhabdus sp.]|uniref:nucleoside triphosphate pyrophosphohydrolase n=1 Tax=Thiohalorhabdus sp. TaxID=3094134 RepID=UPI002FC3CDB2